MSFYVIEKENNFELVLKLNDYFKSLYEEYVGLGINKSDFKYIQREIPDFFDYYNNELNELTGFTYSDRLYHNGHAINNLYVLMNVLTNEEYQDINFLDLYLKYIDSANIKTVESLNSIVDVIKEMNNNITKLNNEVTTWKIICIICIILSVVINLMF